MPPLDGALIFVGRRCRGADYLVDDAPVSPCYPVGSA